MENMERFTPLYAIAHTVMNGTENLRFDKEDYFHVLVFYWLFYRRNRKPIFPVFPYVIETLVKVWENSKLRGNTRPMGSCSHCNFSFSQTFTRVSITVWKQGKCILFLKYCQCWLFFGCSRHISVWVSVFSPNYFKISVLIS